MRREGCGVPVSVRGSPFPVLLGNNRIVTVLPAVLGFLRRGRLVVFVYVMCEGEVAIRAAAVRGEVFPYGDAKGLRCGRDCRPGQ